MFSNGVGPIGPSSPIGVVGVVGATGAPGPMSPSSYAGAVGLQGVPGVGYMCQAILKSTGLPCKCKAKYPQAEAANGVLQYCGKHQWYVPKITCKAIIQSGPKKGQQCKNTASYNNMSCCGTHKHSTAWVPA